MSPTLTGALGYSPFHEYWAARSLTNAWQRVGALTLPCEISDPSDEAFAFGSTAAFSDISNRTVITISGGETRAFLALLTAGREDAFAANTVQPVLWSDASGFVRGAGRVAMRTADEALLISEMSDWHWLSKAAESFDVRLQGTVAAGVRLAGPQTAAVLRACGAADGPGCSLVFPGLGPVLAMGPHEDAVDLWVEPDNAFALAWALERAGARPAGSMALNAWRVANGLLAAGVDWTPAQWCATGLARRTRRQFIEGACSIVVWSKPPPPEAQGAVYWPVRSLYAALLWLPQQGSRGGALGEGVILGPAATD
jgi:glycine cleavage system aminomethyltransferase T